MWDRVPLSTVLASTIACMAFACGDKRTSTGSDLPVNPEPDAGTWDAAACGPKVCVEGTDCFCSAVPPRPRLDVLWVMDDTPGMCPERRFLADGIRQNLDWYPSAYLDVRMAVTTTNVCPMGEPGAVRGAFVYQPASTVLPDCMVKRAVPCLDDQDCRDSSGLPDADNWGCDPVPAQHVYGCDKPESIGTDPYDGDVLHIVNSRCRYDCASGAPGGGCSAGTGSNPCDVKCQQTFEYENLNCLIPGSDPAKSGCVTDFSREFCPIDGPRVLDEEIVEKYLEKWKQGLWAGDPAWHAMPEEKARIELSRRLAVCMTSVQLQQSSCGAQEQGLLAAWMALDPSGENGTQARSFLREDAFLLIIVVSDEDDCSSATEISPEETARCACLADTKGCTADGQCDAANPGPLYPTGKLLNQLKSLKEDPARVAFTAIVGDAIPGSMTSPGVDAGAIEERYLACKCDSGPYALSTYACLTARGQADLGSRYMAVAAGFAGKFGQIFNICDDYQWPEIFRATPQHGPSPQTVCLPRPLDPEETVAVSIQSPEGLCKGLEIETVDPVADYRLVKNFPACPKFTSIDGARTENAVQFNDRVLHDWYIQICYQ